MSTLEIRNKLIENIFLIEDKSFLEALKTIVDTKLASTTYELSDFQIERIRKGREQLMNGNTISNDTVQKKVDKWLSTK
ncbi:MAG: hypothetical protein A2W98_03310 [Bacteroidetes bacterium GWF2_33_38]|nr:MAG: hypothetical protein A2W98_03310 [Bacteroidetes bacterium GWF2_33_38]OFY91938.1 MAG: hypothetical protein A2236_02060 [Bacteroidetes bacterium RIFOXYA2_FULL_33_7]